MNTERDRGFTLVELVVTMAIVGIIGVVLGVVATQGFSLVSSTGHSIQTTAAEQVAIRFLHEDIQNAESLLVNGSNTCPGPDSILSSLEIPADAGVGVTLNVLSEPSPHLVRAVDGGSSSTLLEWATGDARVTECAEAESAVPKSITVSIPRRVGGEPLVLTVTRRTG